jgi:hypothetical protein
MQVLQIFFFCVSGRVLYHLPITRPLLAPSPLFIPLSDYFTQRGATVQICRIKNKIKTASTCFQKLKYTFLNII